MANDEFSFDPRSWSKSNGEAEGEKSPPEAKAAPILQKKDKKTKVLPIEDAPQPRQATVLPQAWQDVADGHDPKPAASPASEPKTATRQQTSLPKAWQDVADGRDGGKDAPAAPSDSPPSPAVRQPTQLPGAWQDVTASLDSGSPSAALDDAAAAGRAHSGNGRLALALAGSLALLAGGGTWAWLTRADPQAAAPIASAAATAPTAAQMAASEAPPPPTAVERAINLSGTEDLAKALAALGIAKEQADSVTRAALSVMKGKGSIRARLVLMPVGDGFAMERLQASYADGSGAVVTRQANGSFRSSAVAADLSKQILVLRGEIDGESFYTSAVTAGLIDALIPEFINAFAFDFNLASEVTPGDTFEVAYEQAVNDSGEPVGAPQLMFGSLTTKQKSVALYRFAAEAGKIGWYDGNGATTKRGFMRTPVDGARITSKFGPRFHPVLHYTRLHGGVDLAAPVGTPIYAASNGTVASASPSRCAGNMVVIRHDKGYETRYFHLSRYAEGLHAGQVVEQGFTIGDVGNTGTCTTGPHLHFEVLIDGQKVDPLGIPSGDGERKRMEADMLAAFLKQRDRVDVARAKSGK